MIKNFYFFVLLFMVPGCMRVSVEKEFSGLKKKAQLLLDEPIERGLPHAYALKEISSVNASTGLSRDNAVSIVLRNNPTLQAEFENLGIAKADLEQSGLFTNPSFDGIFAIPQHASDKKTQVDIYATMNLSDLWIVPRSKQVAKDILEITSYHILEAILDTVADTKNAYDQCLLTELQLKNKKNLLEISIEERDEIYYQQSYGFTDDCDKHVLDSKISQLESEVTDLEQANQVAHIKLKELMGFNPDPKLLILTSKLEIIDSIPPLEILNEFALSNHPDILIAHMKVKQYKDSIDAERAKIFKDVNLGFSFQQDFDQNRGYGPALVLDLPIFDSNYAQIAKAEFLLKQASEELIAAEIKVKSEILQPYTVFTSWRQQIHRHEQKTLPILEHAVNHCYQFAETMQMNVLKALQLNEKYYEINEIVIDLYGKVSKEMVALERAVGKKLVLINKPKTEKVLG